MPETWAFSSRWDREFSQRPRRQNRDFKPASTSTIMLCWISAYCACITARQLHNDNINNALI